MFEWLNWVAFSIIVFTKLLLNKEIDDGGDCQ